MELSVVWSWVDVSGELWYSPGVLNRGWYRWIGGFRNSTREQSTDRRLERVFF